MTQPAQIHPNRYLTRYIMSCYAYYELGTSVFTDAQFDALARKVYECWDDIDHPHKALVRKDSLKSSTTGYYIKYPLMIKMATMDWLERQGKLPKNTRVRHP